MKDWNEPRSNSKRIEFPASLCSQATDSEWKVAPGAHLKKRHPMGFQFCLAIAPPLIEGHRMSEAVRLRKLQQVAENLRSRKAAARSANREYWAPQPVMPKQRFQVASNLEYHFL